jgi:hypothetical protein
MPTTAFRAAVQLLVALAVTPAFAQSWPEIRFPAGASGTEIVGDSPPQDADLICYRLRTGAGQTARVRMLKGRNSGFIIEGVTDHKDDFTFRTEAKTYLICVGQLLRSFEPEPFRMAVSVTGSPTGAAPAAWNVRSGGGSATAVARAANGAILTFSCRPETGLTALLTDLPGQKGTPDGYRDTLTFAVEGKAGRRQWPIPVVFQSASDEVWNTLAPMPPDFLDAFAAGATLTLTGGDGAAKASIPLTGSAAAARALRTACGG